MALVTVTALALVQPLLDEDAIVTKATARSKHQDTPARSAHRHSARDHADVTIARNASGAPIPRSFLGISTEYWSLPVWAPHLSLFERVISLLQVHGGGPLVLRIGGDSADHSFWRTAPGTPAPWVFPVTGEWLRQVSAVVRKTHVRLILDLNLVTGSPRAAAQWARVAERRLPRGSIAGFEIGNEPDIYARSYWLHSIARPLDIAPVLPRSLTLSRYVADFLAYRRALALAVPGVPLIGPAIANPARHANWIAGLVASAGGSLRVVSAHRYPYSACMRRRVAASYPTIARVLSERATAGLAQSVSPAVAIARRAGLPFRMTELNSVTCGGRRGVSNTFATALWAPDALFELLRAGVDAVNMHVRNAINAPFALGTDGLWARPLIYGLIAFRRMLGPQADLVRVGLRTSSTAVHLKAWAVRVLGHVLRVLLIDKGATPVSVALQLPASGRASVERLLAPSPSSSDGVTLGGQHLDAAGQWSGAKRIETVTPRGGRYRVQLPPFSAAIVSVHTGGTARRAPSAAGHRRERAPHRRTQSPQRRTRAAPRSR